MDINRRTSLRGMVATGALLGLDSALSSEPSEAAMDDPGDNINLGLTISDSQII